MIPTSDQFLQSWHRADSYGLEGAGPFLVPGSGQRLPKVGGAREASCLRLCAFLSPLQKVDVPTMLRFLREQRMFMIQTIAQYKFVYQVLVQFLQNSRLI